MLKTSSKTRLRLVGLLFCLHAGLACTCGMCSPAGVSAMDLKRQSDVEAYVDELTGFAELEGISKCVRRVDVNGDNTPFLHAQINGKRDVWLVEIENVRLRLKSAPPGFEDKYVRNFQIFIDPNTGHLLKITSTFDGNDPNMLPEPPAAVAERQMRNSEREIYYGFPTDPPKISLLDALDAILSKGRGNPLLAREILAVYVTHFRRRSRWRPVWSVTLRGIPPVAVKGPRGLHQGKWPAVWQSNYVRNVVDANSGQVLFATNIPQPFAPEDKKRKREWYSNLLKRAVYEASRFRGGFKLYGSWGRSKPHHGYPGSPSFRRFVEGLDEPNAVPFLINVLKNGPDWTDEKSLRLRGGIALHIARCYAALCLGASRDRRAFEPLVDTLENGEYLYHHKFAFSVAELETQHYDIRRYAAIGLGFLNDPNALQPLLRALEGGNFHTIYALARTRDPRVIKPILKAADGPSAGRSLWGLSLHEALKYATKAKFTIRHYPDDTVKVREIPGLGVFRRPRGTQFYRYLWQYWVKEGPQYAKLEFEKYYPGLKRVQKERPDDPDAHASITRKMFGGGIAALPFAVEKVREGDLTLIPAISGLTNGELKKSATQKECLEWWEKNKEKWLMPFEEDKKAKKLDEGAPCQRTQRTLIHAVSGGPPRQALGQ